MKNSLLKYILIYIVLVALQVFIFNNIQLNGFINPYIYVLFILILPFDVRGWWLLVLCALQFRHKNQHQSTEG